MLLVLAEGMEEEQAGSPMVKEKDLDNIAIQGLRPVRKETSWHRKRQLIMSNEPVGWRNPMRLDDTKEESYRVEDHVVPKSEEERACILQAIKTNFLFEHTTEKQNKVRDRSVFVLFAFALCVEWIEINAFVHRWTKQREAKSSAVLW